MQVESVRVLIDGYPHSFRFTSSTDVNSCRNVRGPCYRRARFQIAANTRHSLAKPPAIEFGHPRFHGNLSRPILRVLRSQFDSRTRACNRPLGRSGSRSIHGEGERRISAAFCCKIANSTMPEGGRHRETIRTGPRRDQNGNCRGARSSSRFSSPL